MKIFLFCCYLAVVALAAALFINPRACRLGLPSCISSLYTREPAPHYVAARDLPRNALITDADLKPWLPLPPGAKKHLPSRESLAGKYLRSSVPEGEPIEPSTLSNYPIVDPADARCLLVADPAAYSSTPSLLQPGFRIELACVTSWCDRVEGTIVATTADRRLLVAADPKACSRAASRIVSRLIN